MKIELLGLPGERTAALESALRQALERADLAGAVEVFRVGDMTAMIARGVRQPPALRVDGKVVCRRRVPGVDEIVGFLEAARS